MLRCVDYLKQRLQRSDPGHKFSAGSDSLELRKFSLEAGADRTAVGNYSQIRQGLTGRRDRVCFGRSRRMKSPEATSLLSEVKVAHF